ncbi:MAG: NAD(P)-dependent oxidoreductase [Nanoarchaeota archaeon]
MKAVFFEAHDIAEEYFKTHLSDLDLVFVKEPLNSTNASYAKNAEIISTVVQSRLTADILQELPQLRFIVTRSTGYDHIDLAACKDLNICVSYAPDYGTQAVAEAMFNLLLTLVKQQKPVLELQGKTLGVIGTGRIGKKVIALAKAFGMQILAYDIYQDMQAAQQLGYTYTDLPALLQHSDIVTLHAQLTEATRHLINVETLQQMKLGAILINTSRGALVDTPALIRALQEQHLLAAGLDVVEEEDQPDHVHLEQLKALPNVIVTPHIASKTAEAMERRAAITLHNIRAFLNNQPVNVL